MNKYKLPSILSVILILSGCTKTVYVDENGKKIEPAKQIITDYSDRVKEVCINGVVYYEYSGRVDTLALAPKYRVAVLGNKPRLQEC